MTLRSTTMALLGALLAIPLFAAEEPLRVFLRCGEKTHNPVGNGEHDYPAFLGEWAKILQERGVRVDGALHFPTAAELERTDVLVIYAGDGGNLGADERTILEAYLGRGGGLVVLHDGMCSNDPESFARLAGAAKKHGEMNWSRGRLRLRVVDPEQPITKGMADFTMDDEAFFLLRRTPEMRVLLEAPLPTSGVVEPQAWARETALAGGKTYRSFVWMQGHYTPKLLEPPARDLVLRGIAWAGFRPANELLVPLPVD